MKKMNITSAQHQVDIEGSTSVSIKATIDGEEMFVPKDPANRHYAAILEWAEEDGYEIAEAD